MEVLSGENCVKCVIGENTIPFSLLDQPLYNVEVYYGQTKDILNTLSEGAVTRSPRGFSRDCQ